VNRDAIVRDWLGEIVTAYPDETARFLERERDRFRNPVGHVYRERLPVLVDVALGRRDPAPARAALDDLMRLRAVQIIFCADPVGFLPSLKVIVHRHQTRAAGDAVEPERLAAIDQRIDALTALATETYEQCRVQIAEIRSRKQRP
jgi:hypothetical protein